MSQGPWAPAKTNRIYQHISSDWQISSSCMNDFPKTSQNDWTIGPKWTWTGKASTKSTSTKSHRWECSLELRRNVALNYGRSKCHPNTRLGRKTTNASWPSITCKPTWSISTTLIPTWTEGESVSKALSSIKQLASDVTWLDIDICRQHLAASGNIWQLFPVLGSHGLPAVPDVLADAGEDIGKSTSGALDECSHLSKAEECQVALLVEIHPCKVSEDLWGYKVNPMLQSCQTCCKYPEILAVSRGEAFNLLN